jgi:hypothetical protein
MYNQHDPALGRRKRLAVKAKMTALMTKIERRSDQIYSLYDVLEGQKSSAEAQDAQHQQEMDEEQVENTLQSLGIDVEELGQRAREVQQQQQHQQYPFGLDGEIEESEDDLPWGGFVLVDWLGVSVSIVCREKGCLGGGNCVMRRTVSIYLPEGLEYLICRNGVQSVLMSSIVLSLGEGRG